MAKRFLMATGLIALSIAVATFSASPERESNVVVIKSFDYSFDCITPSIAIADCQIFDQPVVKIGFPSPGEVVVDGFVPMVHPSSNSPPVIKV